MKRRFASGALLAVAGLTIVPLSAAANADTVVRAQTPTASHPYCAILLHKNPATNATTVQRAACSSRSTTQARSAIGAASKTVLMRWWSDAGWQGSYTDISGDYGTCDAEGYTFTPLVWWQQHMSSISGYGACNYVYLWGDRGHNEDEGFLPKSFGSSWLNDDVETVHVFDSY